MNRAASMIVTAVFLVGCSAGDVAPAGPPGPVPDGVSFSEPPATAPPAPTFELELLGGELVDSAAQWAERPLVLVFFEAWCEQCRDQQPEINDVVEDYGDAILFLGVAELSSEDELLEYVAENDVGYPVGIDADGAVWFDYAAAEPAQVVLVSKGGRVLRGWPGGVDGASLRAQLDDIVIDAS